MREINWRSMAIWLIVGILATSGTVALLLYGRAIQSRKKPLIVAYEKLCDKLAKQGISRAPHEGPHDYWRRLHQHQPTLAEQAQPLMQMYVALRYGAPGAKAANEERAFISRARRFRIKY